jgi:energy-coupling factor transporter ATP-binding protein EcfA2
MTSRLGPLRAAVALAAGFVAVRVVYRVVFHGADGSGTPLWTLPELRLPAPFAHVVLFGRVTADGLADAATSAVPIAATILVFGLLNVVVDLPRLLARGGRRGPLRGAARTLAVAWAALPALADAVRAVRRAQRLRGERGSARLLSPVLERTLEKATALAAALELRGMGGRPVDGACLSPVELRGVALQHAHRAPPTLRVADLVLAPGTLTVVAGATGSGKSTLLRALAGLHQHLDGGTATGTLRVVGHDRDAVPPRDTARLVGVVLQHPRDGFAAARVGDEIGLTLELRGVAPVIVAARVAEVAERVGIRHLLERGTATLSAGEAVLVAVAAAVVDHPILLLVDEPLADLDPDMRARIVGLLDALAHDAGVCVVAAEHRVAELAAVADRVVEIGDGVLRDGTLTHASDTGPADPGQAVEPEPEVRPVADPPALHVTALSVSHGSHPAVREASLSVARGEVVAVVGPNGAGKSSLLTAMALPAKGAAVVVGGSPRRKTRRIALVPDASDDLFVCDTVAAECARADRRHGLVRGTTARRWREFLGGSGEHPATATERHPRDLSVGERRCLAIALQLAGGPRVLMIDEPTRGLDPAARALVADTLRGLAAEGVAVVLATHDRDFAAGLGARVLTMVAGVLAQEAPGPRPEAAPAATARRPAISSRPATAAPHHERLRRGHPLTRAGATPLGRTTLLALAAANLVALAAFAWPLVATAVPDQAQAAVPAASLALAPLAALVVLAALDGSVRSAHTLALLGTLAAIGAAVRIVGTGVGGVEAVFILLILAGRAFGARFGLLLGLLTIALSSMVWGGIGPWTPFQMFACAWVGAGAGLLPRRVTGRGEVAMLAGYGLVAAFAFGLVMNLWFWPFAVGSGTAISYEPGAPLGQNLASFLIYSLVTSTASWDALRALTTIIGLALVGRAVLAALRRAKPVLPAPPGADAATAASAHGAVPHATRT